MIAFSLCLFASCTPASTPYYDSTSYDSGKNPYMNQNPYATNPQIQPPTTPYSGYSGAQNPYATQQSQVPQSQYGGNYYRQPYGRNNYYQPAPASRYYSNPYAMPSQQNPYYDQDQYYTPPSRYNSVGEDASDASFR